MDKILFQAEQLGNPDFQRAYGVKCAYQAGAMANGISSAEMVIAMGKAGYLASFGAGGLPMEELENNIRKIQGALPAGPYLFNLLHNPDTTLEKQVVDLYLKHGINAIEAAAFLNLNPNIVYYRTAGLTKGKDGKTVALNKVIAKISRLEVAENFMRPPPSKILDNLLNQGLITAEQAELASELPVVNDITVEADSGGHTDNQALSCIFPIIKQLRDEIQQEYGYSSRIRVGAAGGIGTPEAAAGAFMMGADYIVTGSINQSCLEAGTSPYVKNLLSQADISDMAMCPSADMFEMGAGVQVLKRGVLYPFRAAKLYQLYRQYNSLEDIPADERKNLEEQIFQKKIEDIWLETVAFFRKRGPKQISKAEKNPKAKIALVFRWYLGQSSNWAKSENQNYKKDYQIWCGPAMGAFNRRVKGSLLEKPENRRVTDIADFLMQGAAEIYQSNLRTQVNHQPSQNRKIAQNIQNRTTHLSSTGETKMTRLNLERSKETFKSGKKYLPAGVHYNFAGSPETLVLPFKRGSGSRVWDMDDNEHLDLFCKFGALIVGHCNPRYNEALKKYIDKLTSVDICDLENQVCEKIIDYIPCAEMVRFGLSGTESVQNAIRLARAYSGKNRFIRFIGHYHGNADNIMGGKPDNPEYPVPAPYQGDILDTAGRAKNILAEQSFIIPWNDVKAIESTIEKYGDEIGAIIMEPICINGGGILPKPGYLETVRQLCDKNNIVLIFDEVITGFRVALGGAQSLLGVTLDLAVFGKALAGGGMPVSAIAGKREIMELYAKGKVIHLGTFNGYPLGLVAVSATLELLSEPGCYERMGNYLVQIGEGFIQAAKELGLPLVVQGMPTALIFHSQENQVEAANQYSDSVKFKDILIRRICMEYGIQFSPISRIYSNLMMNQDDVDLFKQRIVPALTEAKEVLKHSGLMEKSYRSK